MSYKLIDANALCGIISNDDYEKVLNAPCIYADLPNGLDGEHYNLQGSQESSKDELKDLSKRVENIEKQMKEDKEEQLKKLKAEIDYAKFCCTLPTIQRIM